MKYIKLHKAISDRVRQYQISEIQQLTQQFSHSFFANLATQQRTYQLCYLALFLDKHRKAHSSFGEPLLGRRCLHHLLITKYNVSILEVTKINLSQALLLLQNDLKNFEVQNPLEIGLSPKQLCENIRSDYPYWTEDIVSSHSQFTNVYDEEFPFDEFHSLVNNQEYDLAREFFL
ncbi:ECs1072 family phage-associated protein [Providencia sp. PROV258]|uniref:ECs1072 family phage-associated protein n=1 Tax=Providencia sp. PROV258 TaxID=2949946 RepID=UPI00234A736E|nr:hypothetical protein [Providencia sp. PROV258]